MLEGSSKTIDGKTKVPRFHACDVSLSASEEGMASSSIDHKSNSLKEIESSSSNILVSTVFPVTKVLDGWLSVCSECSDTSEISTDSVK